MQNRDETIQPTPRKGMSAFIKALLWTAIPVVVLSLIGSGLYWGQPRGNMVSSWFVVAALGIWGLAILVCIGFAIAHKGQIALGILAGIGLGFIGLMVSCFSAFVTQIGLPVVSLLKGIK